MEQPLGEHQTDTAWPTHAYQLLDFGFGRKLERFGELVLDRVSPAANDSQPHESQLWSTASARLTREGQIQALKPDLPETWSIRHESICLQLRFTPFGHVGLFPEHAMHWSWLLSGKHSTAPNPSMAIEEPGKPKRALNLFAYTGSSTLVLARAGWHVTHVDASTPAVAWARTNAQSSQLNSAPVRWIVEDARTYAQREIRRGQLYDLILLDPPSYGHGPSGKAWQIERDLQPLLELCGRLLASDGRLLLTAHSESSFDTLQNLQPILENRSRTIEQLETGRMQLFDRAQRPLDCGWYTRASCQLH